MTRSPEFGRSRILPAILKLARQHVQRVSAMPVCGSSAIAEQNLDVVELVGQLEALDAGGQAGDRFVFAQRVQGKGAAFVLLVVIVVHAAPQNRPYWAIVCTPNWFIRKSANCIRTSFSRAGLDLHGLHQTPAPTLAVVLRRLRSSWALVKDRLAVGIDRRA